MFEKYIVHTFQIKCAWIFLQNKLPWILEKKKKFHCFERICAVHKKKMTSESENLPSDVEFAAANAISSLLPDKSKDKYEKIYLKYTEWCKSKKLINFFSEKVVLAYFDEMSKRYKPSSLWAFYSMLRATVSMKNNIDISKFNNLIAFLKKQAVGHKPKKSEILTADDVSTFLQKADDGQYLLVKVALIVGLAGACRIEELTNLLFTNVKNEGEIFHVIVPFTKTKVSREFFITAGGIEGVNMVELIRKYISIRPSNANHDRFFVGYRGGKCIKLPVGINSFGNMPRKIASFLNLPNTDLYTGHCFRRSSTSLLANTGADLLTIKRHGGWRSNTVCEGYIETSVENKKKIATKILGGDIAVAGTSANDDTLLLNHGDSNCISSEFDITSTESRVLNNTDRTNTSEINISNCSNFTINVYKQ